MELKFTGIIIDSLPNILENGLLEEKTFKTKFEREKLENFSPENLSIGFKNNRTLIFLDMIFLKNISEDAALTNLENDLNSIFPNSRILIAVINETIDFTGYSLVDNGIKIRTKAVAQNQLFLDYGDLYSTEVDLYNGIKEYMKLRPNDHKIFEEKIASLPDINKKKEYLFLRDYFCSKQNKEDQFNYTNGSLDQFIIENEIRNFLNCDIQDLNFMDIIEFSRKKINFKKDTLKEYLYISKSQLGK